MTRTHFSEILADYRAEKLKDELASDWGSAVFYRVPAFALASGAASLGLTPNQLTLLGALLIPLIGLAAWFMPPAAAVITITLLALAFNVLDCADGALARATGRGSLRGRYMDFASDILYRNVAYASYGLVADHIWPGAAFPWVAVGLCCGFLATYARVNRLYAAKLFAGKPSTAAAPRRRTAFDVAFSFLSGLDTLLPIIAFLAWAGGGLWAAMLWFLAFTLGDAVVEVAGNDARARRLDGDASPALGAGQRDTRSGHS